MATLAIGVTLPSASIRTGVFLREAFPTSTETARAGWPGDCATAPVGSKAPRKNTIPPARASTATAPTTQTRFFIRFRPEVPVLPQP